MSKFRVHAVRFYNPDPIAIHNLAYCESNEKIAVSRADNSVEIWDFKESHLYQEKVIPPVVGVSIEALVWCRGRLFSVGLTGVITEYDLVNLKPKVFLPTSFGASWCLAANQAETHLAIGTEEGYVCYFRVLNDSLEYERTFDKQEGRIMCLSWHCSGTFIVTGSVGTIRVWDVKTGHGIQRMTVCKSKTRKETIVWCVAFTKEMHIVSGDSRGFISFWDAQRGIELMSFKSHRADILSLVLEKNERKVWASGVDPQVVSFERVNTGDGKLWAKSTIRNLHTHDVRALTMAGQYLVSGGVDSYLSLSIFPPKIHYKYSPLTNGPCAHVAKTANCLLLQYHSRLELWRLGSTKETACEDNKLLTLSTQQLKLVELKAKECERIICSAISPDANWLVYSTNTSLRLFQVTQENCDTSFPTVSISRIRFLPKECQPARCLAVNSSATQIISLLSSGELQIIKVDLVQPTLLHHFRPEGLKSGCHLLSINDNGRYAAIGSHCGQVIVYDIEKFKVHCKLPRRKFQATALAFTPQEMQLVVVYQDKKIFGFNTERQQYSKWSVNLDIESPHLFKVSEFALQGITFDSRDHSILIVHDDRMLYLINTKILEDKNKYNDAVKTYQRYEHLVHFSGVSNDFMVAVEVSPLSLIHKLPPALKQKKYGT